MLDGTWCWGQIGVRLCARAVVFTGDGRRDGVVPPLGIPARDGCSGVGPFGGAPVRPRLNGVFVGHVVGRSMRARGRSRLRSWCRRRCYSVAGVRQPGTRSAPLAILGEHVPTVELVGPSGEHVLEPPERTSSLDGDVEAVGLLGVVDGADEQLHVPVAGVRSLTVNPQPALRVSDSSSSSSPISWAYSIAARGHTSPVRRSTRPPPYIGSPSRMLANSSRSTGNGLSIGIAAVPSAARVGRRARRRRTDRARAARRRSQPPTRVHPRRVGRAPPADHHRSAAEHHRASARGAATAQPLRRHPGRRHPADRYATPGQSSLTVCSPPGNHRVLKSVSKVAPGVRTFALRPGASVFDPE